VTNGVLAGRIDGASTTFWGMASHSIRHWVIVASREHARRGVSGGFVMANHGKRAPLTRLSRGDGIIMYSPTTTYPGGEPLRAVTVIGEVTGDEPEPSDVIVGGFWRAAKLREIQPLPLEQIRAHLPASSLRFGFFELDAADAEAILALASPMLH
jgi:EVE domain